MPFDGLIAASAHQRLHLFGQHVAHAHGVHLDEVGKHFSELAGQFVAVLLHLLREVFAGQQRVEPCVDRSIDIGGQMLRHIVDGIGHQFFVQLIEDVTYALAGRVFSQQ